MRVIVASAVVPVLKGGGRMIVDDLVRHLRLRDHEVEELLLPSWTEPDLLVEQLLSMRLIDVRDAGERLLAIRVPAHLIRHPSKVLWFIHHQRQAYDLWGTEYQGIPADAEGGRIRRAIRAGDKVAFGEAKAIFTNSKIVSRRLLEFNGLDSEVLYPPLGDSTGYRCGAYGDYIVYPSRVTRIKRQHLLIESMAYTETSARLVIVGAADVPGDREYLENVLDEYGVRDRVDFSGTWIPEEEKQQLIANAAACAYIPYDEDSYGYPTLESFHSRKPVITCTDSGGTAELVEDGVTGRVVPPEPRALAAAIDDLIRDKQRAAKLGEAGFNRLAGLRLAWDHVVERLLA
jgi:glycosyltransferase involved in cell wall biosynthesis